MNDATRSVLADGMARWGAFIEANASWAEAIFFLCAFAESLAFVGFAVPGLVLIATGGALVASGALGFWQVYAAIALGAVLGDAASYWLGRVFGDHVPRVWPFRRRPELLERGSRFFLRHGGKSVFLARFLGPLRPVVPITAGMMAMPHHTFQTANLLSAVIWVPLMMMPGFVMAKGVGIDELLTGATAMPAAPRKGGDTPCVPAPPISGEPPRC
ncbi:DedA family protein [Azospirillum isscasi]|uniref:DedA family protein n=1 Tax=Azospirillum isscasi TaxID=3053926 RepID=A0ABU0WL92_9PROT|nr:DedA family protein [Azospirillum isscasi]MDQ2104587.1 DedA family protein [Azospirillum isscasi]